MLAGVFVFHDDGVPWVLASVLASGDLDWIVHSSPPAIMGTSW